MVQPNGGNFRAQTSIGDSLRLMNVFREVYDADHLRAAGVAVKSDRRRRFYYSSAHRGRPNDAWLRAAAENSTFNHFMAQMWTDNARRPPSCPLGRASASSGFQPALIPAHLPFRWFPLTTAAPVQPLITHQEQFLFLRQRARRFSKYYASDAEIMADGSGGNNPVHRGQTSEKEMKPFFLMFHIKLFVNQASLAVRLMQSHRLITQHFEGKTKFSAVL